LVISGFGGGEIWSLRVGRGAFALTSDGLRFPRCFAVIFVAGFARAAGPRRREGAGDGESSAAARPCEASRGAGGSDSHHMCMAKRSEPIWKNTVDGGGSSFTVGRVAAGNGSTLLVLFFFFTRPLWHSFRLPDALGDYRVRRIALKRDCSSGAPVMTIPPVIPERRDARSQVWLAYSALRSDHMS
jgi:hypothetical protein